MPPLFSHADVAPIFEPYEDNPRMTTKELIDLIADRVCARRDNRGEWPGETDMATTLEEVIKEIGPKLAIGPDTLAARAYQHINRGQQAHPARSTVSDRETIWQALAVVLLPLNPAERIPVNH